MELNDNPFGDARLEFPVSFELRVIYTAAGGEGFAADMERVLASRGIPHDEPRALPSTSAKYGRMVASVTFADKETMQAVYADLGAFPCVKVVL